MLKETKNREVERRPLAERALSTALAGMLAMSVCGSPAMAFASDDVDPSSEELRTEKAVTELIENSVDRSSEIDEPAGDVFADDLADPDADGEEADEVEDEAIVDDYSVAFATGNATVEYGGASIADKRVIRVPAEKDMVFTVTPDEGYAVEEVSYQLLSEGVLEVLAPTDGPGGKRYVVAAEELAEGMAVVVSTVAVANDDADEESSDQAAEQKAPAASDGSEADSAPMPASPLERETTAAEEAADVETRSTDDYAPAYKTVNVNFVSRGTTVSTEKALAGGFVTMPECPGEATFTQTIYACKDAAGNVRRTASLDKAKAYGAYEEETITYTFFGWSNKSDYGSLSTAPGLYDGLQNNSLYAAGQRVFCDSLDVDGDATTLYAVWKQTGGPYFAGESIDSGTGTNGNKGGDGVYRISITLLHNSDTVPVEPSVLSVGYPVKSYGYSDTEKYFTIMYRDVVGSTDGANSTNPSVGAYNPLDRKLTLEQLVTRAMTTAGEENVNGILTDDFHRIVNGMNDNGDGTFNYWNPATQRVIWYVVKEQRESYFNAGEMYIGWHFDGMVVDIDAPSGGDGDDAEHAVSYSLRYNANCSDYAGALPLTTVHAAEKNSEGELTATASVADPADKVYVADNSDKEPIYTDGMTRPGYVFLGWAETPNPSADDVIYAPGSSIDLRGNTTLYAQWESAAGTYTVKHYLQNADGSYTCAESASFAGKVGDEVSAEPNEYPLYVLNEGASTMNGTILGGTSSGNELVLNLFYDRTMPTITVTAPSAQKVYDGTPLVPGDPDPSGLLPDGYTVEVDVEGSQTDVGESPSTITKVTITDPQGNDVTDLFDIELVPGTLKVIPQSIDPGKGPESGDPSTPGAPDDPTTGDPVYKGVTIERPDDVTYNAGDQKQRPIVKDTHGNILVEGKDYELEFPEGDFKNAGSVPIRVKGKGNYTDTFEVSYNIHPIEATIYVDSVTKVFGEGDPDFSGVVEGLLADDELGEITFTRTNAEEAVGTYDMVLTANVANANRNYTYKVVPGALTITPAGGNAVRVSASVEDAEKVYDGKPISVKATADKEGSTLLYYAEGMSGWSTENPQFTNAGTYTVLVKATHPNYSETEVVTAHVVVKPAPVVIKVRDAEKTAGSADPIFSGQVEGLVPGDSLGNVVYYRLNSGVEETGSYADALSALVQHRNGNYTYTVVPGDFIIKDAVDTPAPTDPVDPNVPVDPTDPTDPADPVDPSDPTNPTAPTQPASVRSNLVTELANGEGMRQFVDSMVAPLADVADGVTSEPTVIVDDETPLASFDNDEHEGCWVHPWMILGMIITAVAGAIAILRRRRQTWLMDGDLDEVCAQSATRDETSVAPAADPVRTW